MPDSSAAATSTSRKSGCSKSFTSPARPWRSEARRACRSEARERIQALAQGSERVVVSVELLPERAEHGPHAGRLVERRLGQPCVGCSIPQEALEASDGVGWREVARGGPGPQELENGALVLGQLAPARGPVEGERPGVGPRAGARRRRCVVRTSRVLRRETQRVGGGEPGWVHGRLEHAGHDLALHDAALAQSGAARSVVGALVDAPQLAMPREARQRLTDRLGRKVAEVVVAPQALAAVRDAITDRGGGEACSAAPRLLGLR